MSQLPWILLLLATGMALIVLEVFVPSGGVLGLLAVVALGAAIVTAFVEQGPAAGMAALGGALVVVPAALALAFRLFPATPLGRRVLPAPPQPEDVLPDAAVRRRVRGLVGRRGRTLAELLPWGAVEVDGDRIEAVSEGGPIAAGVAVELVGTQGAAVVVRAVPEDPAARRTAAEPRSSILETFEPGDLWRTDRSEPPLDSGSAANQS